MRVVLDEQARVWRGGTLVAGGSPWRLVRLSPAAAAAVERLRAAGADGRRIEDAGERRVAEQLIERGLAHPVPEAAVLDGRVVVVVPAHDRAELLDACLRSLQGVAVLVVDDGSREAAAIQRTVAAHGATLVRHARNRGPGAARNTGLAATDAPIVAFLDSDCTATPAWLERLVGHFDDPRVGIVAPRVRPRGGDGSLLARFEDVHSELEMGVRRALVREGGTVSFLPAAALLVRRAALGGQGFSPSMRVGEDIDLVWRVAEVGWHARYEPTVVVHHALRLGWTDWLTRRFAYGTSAAELDRRHPGRVSPARLSSWNLATAGLLLARRWRAAALVLGANAWLVGRRVRPARAPAVVAHVVARTIAADLFTVGRTLRREWWPLGWLCLAVACRSRAAAAAAATMLVPIVGEHRRLRPAIDLPRYGLLRLATDAAYGSGVIVGAWRQRRAGALLPTVRLPHLRRGDRPARLVAAVPPSP